MRDHAAAPLWVGSCESLINQGVQRGAMPCHRCRRDPPAAAATGRGSTAERVPWARICTAIDAGGDTDGEPRAMD
jgi:hypothetical protein